MLRAAVSITSSRWVHVTGKVVYFTNFHVQLYQGEKMVAIKTFSLNNKQQVLRATRLQNKLARSQRN